jgi:hypothetical protein
MNPEAYNANTTYLQAGVNQTKSSQIVRAIQAVPALQIPKELHPPKRSRTPIAEFQTS